MLFWRSTPRIPGQHSVAELKKVRISAANTIVRFVCLLAITLCGTFLACTQRSALPNQKQHAVSPSGKYVLHVPIEAQTTNPNYKGSQVWRVTISNRSGDILYKDETSTMVANLNVYWGWDDRDRVWLFDSDDGKIWRWELEAQSWIKRESTKQDGVPEHVLPNYAK